MSTDQPPTVRCPSCGQAVEWSAASEHRPFCSDRCRLIDLGEWASESYRIAGKQPGGLGSQPERLGQPDADEPFPDPYSNK